jgi:transposase InsO family protein
VPDFPSVSAEAGNGPYKTESIHRRAPWKNGKAGVLATQERVAWFNDHRLLASVGSGPPAEAEARSYRQLADNTV